MFCFLGCSLSNIFLLTGRRKPAAHSAISLVHMQRGLHATPYVGHSRIVGNISVTWIVPRLLVRLVLGCGRKRKEASVRDAEWIVVTTTMMMKNVLLLFFCFRFRFQDALRMRAIPTKTFFFRLPTSAQFPGSCFKKRKKSKYYVFEELLLLGSACAGCTLLCNSWCRLFSLVSSSQAYMLSAADYMILSSS